MTTYKNYKLYDLQGREVSIGNAPELRADMLPEEAYRKLKNEEFSFTCDMSEETMAQLRIALGLDELDDLYNIVLAALEKQMPKKPIKYEYMGEEYDETKTHCPRCNGELLFGISSPYDVYCHHCGQALDWGDEK